MDCANENVNSRLGYRAIVDSELASKSSVNAASLLTVDPDFWDASNKSNPKAKNKSSDTKKFIESKIPIKILLPSEFKDAVMA